MGTTSPTTARDTRLDVARGIAICGVVLAHVARGLASAGLLSPSVAEAYDHLLYPWILSVFVFVTGAFVPRGVAKLGRGMYLRDRVTRFLIVYLVWTVIQGCTQLLADSSLNHPITPLRIVSVWIPIGHLWYLPFLVLALLVFVPVQPWLPRRAPWILAATAVVSVAFWGSDFGYVGTQGLGLLVWFVAGMVIGSDRARAALDRLSRTVAGILAVILLAGGGWAALLTGATAPTFFWEGRTVLTVAAGVAVSIAMSIAVFLLGHCLQAVSFLATLGRRSLEIYLAHITMAAGTRIVLVHLGVENPWLLVPLCFIAGVVGSLLAATVLRRLALGWVFDGPSWLTTSRSRGGARSAKRSGTA